MCQSFPISYLQITYIHSTRYLSSQNVKNQVLYFNLLNHRHWSSGPFPTRLLAFDFRTFDSKVSRTVPTELFGQLNCSANRTGVGLHPTRMLAFDLQNFDVSHNWWTYYNNSKGRGDRCFYLLLSWVDLDSSNLMILFVTLFCLCLRP